MAIFLLIAGTYTPFCLAALQGWMGWTILAIVWTCCVLGIVMKALYIGKKEIISTIAYVVMGWIILFAIKPLYMQISTASFVFLVVGGVSYTAGTFFFLFDRIKYNHSIWHLFVLGGSICHFFSVLSLLRF
jgi:hemolysin III